MLLDYSISLKIFSLLLAFFLREIHDLVVVALAVVAGVYGESCVLEYQKCKKLEMALFYLKIRSVCMYFNWCIIT